MSIAIVVDSTCDIEPEVAAQLGIDVVPLFVRFGDRSFRDYLELSRSEFYRMIETDPQLPNTSQPTSRMFEDAFRPHVEAGRDIFCLTISSKLSGTINAAQGAARQFARANIAVVDSETVAGGLRMQVLSALELAKNGASLEALTDFIAQQRRVQRLYACIPDLSHAVRTGRIGKAKAALGTLMRIVPVIALRDGEVVAEAQVRTLSRARETMIDLAIEAAGSNDSARFLVMHTNAPALAGEIRARLNERLGDRARDIGLLEAGPAIATHAGRGAVGIFTTHD